MGSKASEIILALRAITVAYNKPCTDEFLEVFTEGLIDVEANWGEVYKSVINRFEFMPNLKQIRDIATGESRASQKLIATEIVNELETAVGRIGRYNFQRARDELRPEIWAMVQQLGGWSQACKQDFGAQGTFVRLRDTAENVCTKIKDDQEFIKLVKIEQKSGTNDSRALIAPSKGGKSSGGDSSFDVKKALKDAFPREFEPKKSGSDEGIEQLKIKLKNELKNA